MAQTGPYDGITQACLCLSCVAATAPRPGVVWYLCDQDIKSAQPSTAEAWKTKVSCVPLQFAVRQCFREIENCGFNLLSFFVLTKTETNAFLCV